MIAPMTIMMIVIFAILVMLSVPIAWSLGLSALIAILLVNGPYHIAFLASRLYNASNSFILMSLPFFILAGNIMSKGGLSRRLLDFCKILIGTRKGGLGVVTMLTALFFSAISGSNAATTAAVGGMVIPELKEEGYPEDFSAATVAAAGVTGMVIPPSSAMVVYAATAGASLPALFMAGIIPGIFMSVTIMAVVLILSRKMVLRSRKEICQKSKKKIFINAIGALMMPVIVLGGIYTGVFTATEAAAVACVYALIITVLVYRDIRLRQLPRIVWESAIVSAVGMGVIICASLFGYVLILEHVPEQLCEMFLSFTDSRLVTLLVINIILLLAGCVMTPNSAIIILVPILMPICASFGINPVAIGVIIVMNLSIGAITPPVGGDVFIASSIAKIPIEKIFRRIICF